MVTACIFTIGTEITDGQITDRNSQWISEQLTDLGVSVQMHCSLPDDQKMIVQYLKKMEPKTNLIFISGGLGPTSDDLTRNAISEYVSLPLALDNSSWMEIQKKLSSRNVTLREGHKNQAMLPRGAQALQNSVGIAPGIFLQHSDSSLFILPGPPRELQAIWEEHVTTYIKSLNIETKEILKKWMCHGIPESELAFLTDNFFRSKNLPVRIGYRIHKPNVEVKVWFDKNQDHLDTLCTEFEEILKTYLEPIS